MKNLKTIENADFLSLVTELTHNLFCETTPELYTDLNQIINNAKQVLYNVRNEKISEAVSKMTLKQPFTIADLIKETGCPIPEDVITRCLFSVNRRIYEGKMDNPNMNAFANYFEKYYTNYQIQFAGKKQIIKRYAEIDDNGNLVENGKIKTEHSEKPMFELNIKGC